MNKPLPPSDFDNYAMDMARRIASIDRARLPGSTPQFIAVIQAAMVDAMMFSAGYALEAHVTVKSNRITMSPAMPLCDHEMDVLRSIASRLKSTCADSQTGVVSHTHAVAEAEETKPC
jgi:hypothetical protein